MGLAPLDLPAVQSKLKLREEVVEVEGVGPLLLRELSHEDMQGFHELRGSADQHQRKRAAPYVITRSVRRPDGSPMFTSQSIDEMMQSSAALVDQIGAAVLKFCKATPEAESELGEASAATDGPASA